MAFVIFNEFDNELDLYSNSNELIKKIIDEKEFDKYYIIQPTGRLVRLLNNYFTDKYFDKFKTPSITIKISTLESFIKDIFKLIPDSRKFKFISTNYKLALLDKIQSEIDLEYYSQNGKIKLTLLRKLLGLLDGLKKDGITYEKLIEDLESENDEVNEPRKLRDIAKLFIALKNEMANNHLIDEVDALEKVRSFVLSQNVIIDQLKNKTLYFDNFNEFKKPEIELLKALKDHIQIIIDLDYSEDYGPTFDNMKESIADLLGNGFRGKDLDNIEEDPKDISSIAPAAYLRKFLFRESVWDNPKIRGHINEHIADHINIYECYDKKDEVLATIKLIKHLHIENSIKLSDIRINSRNPSDYSDLIRHEFRRNGIPVNISDRFALKNSIVSKAIFNFIKLLVNGFERNDLLAFVRHPLVQIEHNDRNINNYDIALIAEISAKFRIFGGHDFGSYRSWLNASLGDKAKDEQFKELISSIFRSLDPFLITGKELSFKDFTKLLKDMIRRFKLMESILNERELEDDFDRFYAKRDSEMNAKALSAFIDLLNESEFILGNIDPNKKYDLVELNELLFSLVIETKYQVRELFDNGVTFTSIEQSRGIKKKVNILLGANEGVFPLKYSTDILLGKELKSSYEKHMNSERNLFYQFLTNGDRSGDISEDHIFYSAKESENDILPSNFLSSLTDLFTDKSFDSIVVKLDSSNRPQWLANITEIKHSNDEINVAEILEEYFKNSIPEKDSFIIKENLSDRSKKRLVDHANNTFSVSRLDKYSNYSYDYFIDELLSASQIEDIDEEVNPLETGNVLHNISNNFFKYLIKDGVCVIEELIVRSNDNSIDDIIPVDILRKRKEDLRSILYDIGQKELNKIKFDHPYFSVFEQDILGTDNKKGILDHWLEIELEKRHALDNIYPCLHEFGFPELALSNVDDEKINLIGRIDRIDIRFIDEKARDMIIIDYKKKYSESLKIGRSMSIKSFQMTLYSKVFKILAKYYFDLDLGYGAAYYNLYSSNSENGFNIQSIYLNSRIDFPELFITSKYALSDDESIESLIDNSIENAIELTKDIQDGIFFETRNKGSVKTRRDLLIRDQSIFL